MGQCGISFKGLEKGILLVGGSDAGLLEGRSPAWFEVHKTTHK